MRFCVYICIFTGFFIDTSSANSSWPAIVFGAPISPERRYIIHATFRRLSKIYLFTRRFINFLILKKKPVYFVFFRDLRVTKLPAHRLRREGRPLACTLRKNTLHKYIYIHIHVYIYIKTERKSKNCDSYAGHTCGGYQSFMNSINLGLARARVRPVKRK